MAQEFSGLAVHEVGPSLFEEGPLIKVLPKSILADRKKTAVLKNELNHLLVGISDDYLQFREGSIKTGMDFNRRIGPHLLNFQRAMGAAGIKIPHELLPRISLIYLTFMKKAFSHAEELRKEN